MKLHGSARTCPNSRRLIASRELEQSWTLGAAAEAAGVSVVTARKWSGALAKATSACSIVPRVRNGSIASPTRRSKRSRICGDCA